MIVVLPLVMAVSYACGSSSAPKAKAQVLASVKLLSGASQTGTVNSALASAIVIQALDSSGRPIAGLSVIYGPSDGTLNPASNTTDSTGKASTIWTLGSRVGPDTLFAAATQNASGAVAADTIYATASP